jgi:UDP-glucose 4-epimerase
MNMTPQMQEAVNTVMKKLRAMNPAEFRAELDQRRNSDIANLFAMAREFDDNFMRLPPRKTADTPPVVPVTVAK